MTYNHGPTPRRGELWACEWPERPADRHTVYSEGCDACRLALNATLVNQGDLTLRTYNGRPGIALTTAAKALADWQDA